MVNLAVTEKGGGMMWKTGRGRERKDVKKENKKKQTQNKKIRFRLFLYSTWKSIDRCVFGE
jgi:hypothetical protein